MEVVIIKSMSNKKFISKKHENYPTLSWLTKRLWISEEIPVITDGSVVYNISFKSGLSVEGRILGAGFDEIGFYIVFNMLLFNLISDIDLLDKKRIPSGTAELWEVFNPNEDEEFKALFDERYMSQYFFGSSIMQFKPTKGGIVFKFSLGALGDEEFKIELSGIIEEEYTCENNNGLNAFVDGNINEVYFRKDHDGEYVIRIENSYKDYIYPDGYYCFSEPVKPKVVKHRNEYMVKCKNINVQKSNYFIDNLQLKDIKCYELHDNCEENFAERVRGKWINSFLEDVNTNDIYIDHYLWHVFSYERLIAIKGEDAQDCLNIVRSNTMYVFFNNENVDGKDICYRLENAGGFNHEMLQCYSDVYVTDEDFTWTYVRTHEDGDCGPYFYRKGL